MGKDVIVACDFSSKEQVLDFLDKFENEERKPFLKIGMELYYAEGPQIVREINRVQDERAKTILTSRYVLYMQWDAIANDLGYEMSYVYRLHQDAVRIYAALNGYEY